MDRWNWMAARAFAPAIGALVFAFVSMEVITAWATSPFLAGAVSTAKLVPLAALTFALGWWAWTCFRLYRADQGMGLLCDCGGLLGIERGGRYGPYRRCLACSRNVARRHYE